MINKSRIKLGYVLLFAGLFKETLDTLDKVIPQVLPDSLKRDYYIILARTYFDMSDYTSDKYYAPLYNNTGKHFLDSAINLCNDSCSARFLSLNGLKFLRCGDIKKARFNIEKLLKYYKLEGHEYAVWASCLSYIYKLDNEPELEIQLLIKAAIADIVNSTTETNAIRKLAEIVYSQNNIDKAYIYVKMALEDANFYGSKFRKAEIAEIMPTIEERQVEIVTRQRHTFYIYSLILSMLSVLVILIVFIIFRQLKILRIAKNLLSESNNKLSEVIRRLEEANLIKEEYFVHFFDTILQYINMLEKLKISISRMITANQISEVKKIMSNLNIHREREQFYNNFDSIFLTIFPDFMKEFNSFLKEEIIISEGEQLLTPEIRIYALMRLGIKNNDKIAHFLGYTLHTIYCYKTKIKKQLILPADEFDTKLMNIRTVKYG
jgi:hypothetical protein